MMQNPDVPPDVKVATDQGQQEGGADRLKGGVRADNLAASRSVHHTAMGIEDIEISVVSGTLEQGDISAARAAMVRDRHKAKLPCCHHKGGLHVTGDHHHL